MFFYLIFYIFHPIQFNSLFGNSFYFILFYLFVFYFKYYINSYILYSLCGYLPFNEGQQIKKDTILFRSPYWDDISDEGNNFFFICKYKVFNSGVSTNE